MLAICMGSGVPPARIRVMPHDPFWGLKMAMETEACLGPAESESEVEDSRGATRSAKRNVLDPGCNPDPLSRLPLFFVQEANAVDTAQKTQNFLICCGCIVQHALGCDARVWRGRKGTFGRHSRYRDRTPAYLRPDARTCQVFGRFGIDSPSSGPPMKTPSEERPRFRVSSLFNFFPGFGSHPSNLRPDSSSPAASSRHRHVRGSVSREHPRPGLGPLIRLDRVRGRRRSPVDLDLDTASR